MKVFSTLFALAILFFASCKEQPIQIDMSNNYDNWDTSYNSTVEAVQAKKYLLEELTGVRCSNCPEGAEFLDELNSQNNNDFIIVGLNTGALTNPIPGKSIQDFRTSDGDQIRSLVFGGEGNKPSVSFDRLPLSSGQNKYFVESSSNWAQAISKMKLNASTTPVNVSIKSQYNSNEDKYELEVQLNFTQSVAEPMALNIFLIENGIQDAFIESDTPINYNHVFRAAVTPAIGKIILTDQAEKKAGLTYIYRTSYTIHKEDAKQKFWKPENMKVIAFVSKATPEEKHVFQAAQIDLK